MTNNGNGDIKTTQDAVKALLAQASKANRGEADPAQAGVLCKAIGQVVSICRLQMLYNEQRRNDGHIAFLEDAKDEAELTERRTTLGRELEVVERELAKDTLSDKRQTELKRKRNDLLQERTNLDYSLNKR